MTIAIDNEATGLFPHKGCRAFTISGADDQANTYLWKFKVDPYTRKVKYEPHKTRHFWQTIRKHHQIVFHNANYDIQLLSHIPGIDIDLLFEEHIIHDTMVMSHAYKSDSLHGLKPLGVTLLDYPEDDEKLLSSITQSARTKAEKLGWCIASKKNPHPTLVGTQEQWWRADYWVPEQLAQEIEVPERWTTICDEYATGDVVRTIGIFDVLQELMDDQQKESYEHARQLIQPILDMEYEGVTIIPDQLEKSRKYYAREFDRTIRKIQGMVGSRKFNVNSPDQLAKVMFGKYEFKPFKHGKDGPSTDKETIVHLLKDCPTENPPERFQFLIELKRLRKIKSTHQYLENYDRHRVNDIVKIRGESFERVESLQPTFKQWETDTNRMACEQPNTTNVGKDDSNNPFTGKDAATLAHIAHLLPKEESFKLRNVFGPREGNQWTCIDFQQFQLLIFAVVSESHDIIDTFLSGGDMHQATARAIFKTDDISAIQRTAAKNCNFGILFGAGPAKIEQTAGMPGLFTQFTNAFPKAKRFLELQASQAKRRGYVNTVGGYRLYVPRDRAYAASCYVIQGTEAEIVRKAMVSVNQYIYNIAQPYRMIMMVHDELVFRHTHSHDRHLHNIMGLMEREGNRLGIPARVDADVTYTNWANKQPYKGVCECGGTILEFEQEDEKVDRCYECDLVPTTQPASLSA
jgi:DNA polymerase I-like protein with 3'-5' exonuclease and polymerase domains